MTASARQARPAIAVAVIAGMVLIGLTISLVLFAAWVVFFDYLGSVSTPKSNFMDAWGDRPIAFTIVNGFIGLIALTAGLIAVSKLMDFSALIAKRTTKTPDVQDLRNRHDIDGLTAALGFHDPAVRAAAAIALGDLKVDSASFPLAIVSADGEEAAQLAARAALTRIGQDPVEVLVQQLRRHDADIESRRAAAVALGTVGDDRAIPPLSSAVRDVDLSLRHRATQALGNLSGTGDPRIVDALAVALTDQDWIVGVAAVKSLQQVGEPAVGKLSQAFYHSEGAVRLAAVDALTSVGTEQAIEAIKLGLTDKDPEVKARAQRALRQFRK